MLYRNLYKRVLFLTFLLTATLCEAQDVGVSNIITQNSGCEQELPQSVTVEITNYSSINIVLTIDVSYQLNNGPIVVQSTTISLGGGANTTFTFAQQITSGLVYGNNTIVASTATALDLNPSNDSFTKNFNNDQNSIGGLVTPDTSVCSGNNSGTLSLSGELGNILNWQFSINSGATFVNISNTTDVQNFNDLSTTTLYRAAIKNGTCPLVFSQPAAVNVIPIPNLPEPSSNGPVCLGNTLELSTTTQSNATYFWTGPNGYSSSGQKPNRSNVQMQDSGYYSVIVTSMGCSSQPDSIFVKVDTLSVGGEIDSSLNICKSSNEGSLVLTNQIGSVIQWEFSVDNGTSWQPSVNTTSTYNFVNLPQTTQFRTLVKNGVCPSAYSAVTIVTVNDIAEGGAIYGESLDPNFAVCPDSNSGVLNLIGYKGTIDHWEYTTDSGGSWVIVNSTSDQLAYVDVHTTRRYRAIVTGCSSSDTSISYLLQVNPNLCKGIEGIANLITPNGDGKNDTWLIANIDSYPSVSVRIFTRNGLEIFSSTAYKNEWDGTYQGRPLQDGTYYYLLQIEGQSDVKKGSINLLR